MFEKLKLKVIQQKRKRNRRNLKKAVIELYKTCCELGCQHCQYENYDDEGHCRLSSFDKNGNDHRPRFWRWINKDV